MKAGVPGKLRKKLVYANLRKAGLYYKKEVSVWQQVLEMCE